MEQQGRCLGGHKTFGTGSRRLQDEEHWMPSALTGKSCVTWRLADDPAELGHARELVRKTLAAWGLGEQAELAELVVTELATNALRHGTGQIDTSLSYSRDALRTEVHDHGAGRPDRRRTTGGGPI